MPSPAALAQWATEQHSSASAYFNDPDSLYDGQIRLHTEESGQCIPLVQGLLADQIDATQAAAELASICMPRLKRNEGVQAPLGPWLVVCRAIEHFADDEAASRAKLAAFLVMLARNEIRDADGRLVRAEEGRSVFWSELPGWNLAFRDHLTGVPSRGSYQDHSDSIAQWQRRFHNGNLFQAHWLQQVGETGGPPGQYRYAASLALQHLGEALETTTEASPLGRRRAERYAAGVLPWITEAGAALLRLCRAGHRRGGARVFAPPAPDAGVAAYAFAGDDGFHMERWRFWQAALRRVAATEGIAPGVARRAAEAADEMDRLESLPSEAEP